MSSEDELDGFNPTTPAPTKIGPPRGAAARQAKAGPSKPTAAASKKGNKAAQDKSNGDTSKSIDVVVLSSDDDGKKTARKETTAAKGKGKEPVAAAKPAPKPVPQANGKAKAKGKAKASSPPPSDAMQVDSGEPAEEVVPPAKPARTARTNVKPASDAPSPPPAKRPRQESALEAEVTRLRRRLDDVAAQRDRLSEQLKEALEVRETEPERLLAESLTRYEESIQSQQHLLQEQSTSLAYFKALPDSGQLHNLQFITRDAAAEESKAVMGRNKKLEQTLRDKDARIAELESTNRELDKQLQAEVQMAKEYREKNPQGKMGTNGPSKPLNGSSSPRDNDVLKLYEDLTNFLITNVVPGQAAYPAFPDLREKTFHCTCTHVGPVSGKGINPSVQFTLRHMWKPRDHESASPPTSKKDLIETVEYIPNLQNESEEFKAGLDFFKDSFVFERDQLHVFMRTLGERLADLAGEESDGEKSS
ncbi:hypothetical protein BC629DRAFT_1730934 [Irpex lacteus]|nr:hypothetical protein BC629DRAFT_1730934 [Irpex lacteus]